MRKTGLRWRRIARFGTLVAGPRNYGHLTALFTLYSMTIVVCAYPERCEMTCSWCLQ